MKTIFCLLTILGLAGCGWQLRGSHDDATPLTHLNLSANDPYTLLYRTFREEFERRRIQLDNNAAGVPHLKLLDESLSTRIISYNTELDPAEEELTLRIHYLINNQPFFLEDHKILEQNKNRAAAGESEKKTLTDQMRRYLAGRILQQVARTPTTLPLKEPATGEGLSR